MQDIDGEVLCGKFIHLFCPLPIFITTLNEVSQFTLQASTRKKNKPDFHAAAGAEKARQLYDCFFSQVQSLYDADKVKNGVFQAMMEGKTTPSSAQTAFCLYSLVNLQNSGPVSVDYHSHDGEVARYPPVPIQIHKSAS